MNGFQITPIMAVATRVDMMMGIMHTGVSWSIADAELYPPKWALRQHTRENLRRGLGPIADSRRRPRPTSRNASVSLPLNSVYGRSWKWVTSNRS